MILIVLVESVDISRHTVNYSIFRKAVIKTIALFIKAHNYLTNNWLKYTLCVLVKTLEKNYTNVSLEWKKKSVIKCVLTESKKKT